MSLTRMRRKFEVHMRTGMWIILIIFIIGIFFFYGSYVPRTRRAAGAGTEPPAVLGTVNGEPVTRELLDRKFVAVTQGGRPPLQFLGWAYMNAFSAAVGELLVRQEAAKMGVNVTRDMVDQRINTLVAKQLKEAISRRRKRGGPVDEDEMRRNLEENSRLQQDDIGYDLLVQGLLPKLMANIKVSDKELTEQLDQVKARHIQVAFTPPKGKKRTEAEALAKANKLLAQLRGGVDFAALAQKESDDIMTVTKGGAFTFEDKSQGITGEKARWFRRGQIMHLDHALFSQKIGIVGEPMKTEFGYHLVLVEGRKREIPKDFEKKKEEYRRGVVAQRAERVWEGFRRRAYAAAKIEVTDPLVLAQQALMERGDANKAIGYLRQAAAYAPSISPQVAASVHYLLGNLLSSGKKYEQAAAEYEEVLNLTSDARDQVMLSLAETYVELKKARDAIDYIKGAIEEAPDNTMVSTTAEALYKKLGRSDLAEAEKKRRDEMQKKAAQEAKERAKEEAESAAPAPQEAKPPAR
jgi:foldase protein PrsA